MSFLISIITPVYNCDGYIEQTINSILAQTYDNWELLIINDGSTDSSKDIVFKFKDPRIRYFEQNNKGVSSARNVGLRNMNGAYFCFLDADDMFPENSLNERLNIFKRYPNLDFVDGSVEVFDEDFNKALFKWKPKLQGPLLKDLVSLSGKSFFGPTWMIRIKEGKSYNMKEGLTHGEDLLFYMELARQSNRYGYTQEVILYYRNRPGSAMKNLDGLEKGYLFIGNELKRWQEVSDIMFFNFKLSYKKSMSLAFIKNREFFKLFKLWIQKI